MKLPKERIDELKVSFGTLLWVIASMIVSVYFISWWF